MKWAYIIVPGSTNIKHLHVVCGWKEISRLYAENAGKWATIEKERRFKVVLKFGAN